MVPSPTLTLRRAFLSRFDITFPNTLDRYILREFLKILVLVLVSTAALFVIFDYTDLSGDIRANHIALQTVLAYYRFGLFGILNYTLPISVLVATLVTFGIFSKNNEVTAFKSGGMSLYRAALPIVGIAIAISGLAYLQLDYVLPYSNQRVEELRNKIKAKRTLPVAAPHQQKLWFLGKGRYLINFLAYDRDEKELSQVQVFEFHPTKFRLTRRIYADHARWDGVGWEFSKGWMRSFGDDGTSTYAPITRPLRLYYSERPEDFATEARAPDQMTFAELRRYIETIRKSGLCRRRIDGEAVHEDVVAVHQPGHGADRAAVRIPHRQARRALRRRRRPDPRHRLLDGLRGLHEIRRGREPAGDAVRVERQHPVRHRGGLPVLECGNVIRLSDSRSERRGPDFSPTYS